MKSAAMAAKETSIKNYVPLEDDSKHILNTVQAQSKKNNILGVDTVIANANFPTEHKNHEPVHHCPFLPPKLTTHQLQVGNFPPHPDKLNSLMTQLLLAAPDCPCFYVNKSLSQDERCVPISEVLRFTAL